VLDFGIAKVRDLGGIVSRTGSPLGTPGFMPPEQASGRHAEIDARADVWAVGATMFTLLSGESVHQASTPNQMLAEAMCSPARSVGGSAPHLPASVTAVVDTALAFNRADRWRSAHSMQDALRTAHGARVHVAADAAWPRRTGVGAAPDRVDISLSPT